MTTRSVFLLSAVLGAGMSMAHAQVSMASVNGVIRDTCGTVIPEAALVLRSTDTGNAVENLWPQYYEPARSQQGYR